MSGLIVEDNQLAPEIANKQLSPVVVEEGCPVEESLTEINQAIREQKKEAEDDAIVIDVEKILAEEEELKKKGKLRRYMRCYFELWKTRLSSLVVFTTAGGYYAASNIHKISAEKDEILQLLGKQQNGSSVLALFVGTFLQSACANSFNEILEIERDKLMKRTFNRPLPRSRISVEHAVVQALIAGTAGTYILHRYTNKETALMGLANLLLYVCVYTPTKPLHWINTWVGTLNGSLPPLMGVTAAMLPLSSDKFSLANMFSANSSDYNRKLLATGLFMFGSMYLWQISHFMAISYKCRGDYAKAGYKMLSISNPQAAATQSLLHSVALLPLCWALPAFGVVPWWFAVLSTPINYYYLIKPSIVFKKDVTYDNATRLFFKSLYHLSFLYGFSILAFKMTQSDAYNKVADKVSNFFSDAWTSVKSLF